MAYCAVPDVSTQSSRDPSPGVFTLSPPAATGEICNTTVTSTVSTGGSTPISSTTTVAGPPGPVGPQGAAGSAAALTLAYNGTTLGTVNTLDIASFGDGLIATISGTTGTITNNSMNWAGNWSAGTLYEINDVVLYNPPLPAPVVNVLGLSMVQPPPLAGTGNAYICTYKHVATDDTDFATGHPQTNTSWSPVTQQGQLTTPTTPSIQDTISGLFDWTKKLTPAGWLATIAAGAGIIWAGNAILSALSASPNNSANQLAAGISAQTVFTGSPMYGQAYTPPSVQQVVASLCNQIMPSTSYDVSLLPTDQYCSLVLQQVTSIRTLLDQMAQLFLFDMVDSSGILKFVPRNSSPVGSLTYADMAFNPTGEVTAPVTYKRMQSIDLPRSVQLTYLSVDLDYNNYTQTTYIPTFTDGQDVILQVPLVLDHTLAKTLTEQILINAHLERQQFTFRTSYRNAVQFEPGDIITIPDGNVRIIQMEEVSPAIIEFVCCMAGYTGAPSPIVVGGVTIGYTASSFVTSGQSAQIPAPTINVPTSIGYTDAFFVDPPVLSSTDTQPRMFACINTHGATNWPGATIYRSMDNGLSYSQVASANQAGTWGVVSLATSSHDYHTWDNDTTITVQMKYGSLASASDASVLSGSNLCMIGQECIAFGTATLVAPLTYQLSHLLRGRQGTEFAVSTHQANELFYMLDNSLVEIVGSDSQRNIPYLYKIVTNGSDQSKVNPSTATIVGQNTIPWAPVLPLISQDSSSNLNISWVERPRYVNSLINGSDDPHDYDFGGYCVAIYSTGTGTGPIGSTSALSGGSSYVDGTYSNIALAGGTGSGAVATITVLGGVVTNCVINLAGSGYTVGDALSTSNSNLGGTGAGFQVIVASIVVRTTFVTTSAFQYTKAMQVADFGSAQSHLTAKIFQVSNKYGGGVGASVSI